MLASIQNQDGNITVLVDCKPYTFNKKHPNYNALIECVELGDEYHFSSLFDIQTSIQNNLSTQSTGFKIENGKVYYNGVEQQSLVARLIIEAWKNNKKFTNLENFLVKLSQNPSSNSVNQLYTFLQAKGLPITEDGDFIAWKSVCNDYMDKYSRTIANHIGSIVEVPRNKVDDNFNNECSHGLHVGALEYSGPDGWYHSEGDIVLAVKVNPKDAVAVPKDHKFGKLRVCRYEIVGEYKSSTEARVVLDRQIPEFVKNIAPTSTLNIPVDDFLGAKIGDKIEFVYVKPDGISQRKIQIVCFGYDDDNHIENIIGLDLNDGSKQKTFKVERIDLESFEVTK